MTPTAQEEELKPCPFCGGEARIAIDGGGFRPQCKKCNTALGWWPEQGRRYAIIAWNTRVQQPAKGSLDLMPILKWMQASLKSMTCLAVRAFGDSKPEIETACEAISEADKVLGEL